MRIISILITALLVFVAAAISFGQTADVGAVGPPTDNVTIPDFPAGDQSLNEIVPQVVFVRQGPTSQTDSMQPNAIPGLVGISGEDIFKVTGDETWFLDVDINMPGWLYIYEYFPGDGAIQGEWIAYKWELLKSGSWRLGPFRPESNEPEGEHIYNIWFYSNGQWAGESQDAPQSNRVYWIYEKGQPVEQPVSQIPPLPPALPPQEATFVDNLRSFITQPVGITLGALVLIGIGVLGFFIYRRYHRRISIEDTDLISDEAEPEEASAVLPEKLAVARIALPNGVDIHLAGNSRTIGRSDLARALGLDDLGMISRRHFVIKSEDEQFYIEDLGSTNGTRCNGTDISGQGPVIIKDDDIIEPAGIISLKFYLL